MECAHCQKKFQDRTGFDSHRQEHVKIQRQLGRSGTRTYGTRYESSQDTQNPEGASSSTQIVPSKIETQDDTPRQEPVKPVESDPRIQFIINRFPPFDDSDATQDKPTTPEYSCPDCDFKFRNLEDRNDHRLSRFCRGCDIKAFLMIRDDSKPIGYKMQEYLLPFDWKHYNWSIICKKCGGCFSSEEEMKIHELTHPVVPSRCLHCDIVLSSSYELDEHYEWHDDMEYRNHRDAVLKHASSGGASDNAQIYKVDRVTDSGCGDAESSLLNENLEREYESLVGISFISAEDIERSKVSFPTPCWTHKIIGIVLAPDGKFQEIGQVYISDLPIEADMEKISLGPEPTMRDQTHTLRKLDKIGSMICGHGKPGYMQFSDASGRLRWLEARGAGELCALGSKDQREYGRLIKKWVAAEEGDDIKEILHLCQRALKELLALRDIGNNANDVSELILLTRIGSLYQSLYDFDNAIIYNVKALCLAEKLYSKDNLNSFLRMNDLAVCFESIGKLHDARDLYLRSLAGRMRLSGENDADTLMNMQELGTINVRLNNYEQARPLLERAYLGYENLRDRNEEMTCKTLFNLTQVYTNLGMSNEARKLLEELIPRMREQFGLASEMTTVAISSFLHHTKSTSIPPLILPMIEEMQEKRYDTGKPILEWLASKYAGQMQYWKAGNLFKTLAEWEKLETESSLFKSVGFLVEAGRCFFLVGRLDDAYEISKSALEKLPLLDQSKGQGIRSVVDANLQAIQVEQQHLLNERVAWGLDKPQQCSCGERTIRLCSTCQTRHFCSSACENNNRHECHPTVTPIQLRRGVESTEPLESLQEGTRRTIATLPHLWRQRLPIPISTRRIYIDPSGFASLRVWIDSSKLVSVSVLDSADVRFWMILRGDTRWNKMDAPRTYLFPNIEEGYLIVTPGERVLTSIIQEYTSITGISKDNGMQAPDQDIVDYLQTRPGDKRYQLVAVLISWEE